MEAGGKILEYEKERGEQVVMSLIARLVVKCLQALQQAKGTGWTDPC